MFSLHFSELTRALGAVATVAALVLPVAPQAHAEGTWKTTLQGRDLDGNAATFEAYYDTALNITWLADGNYAQTSGYSAANSNTDKGVENYPARASDAILPDGRMGWDAANTWAATLNVYGTTGWRLPTMVAPGAYEIPGVGAFSLSIDSELAHLYYLTLGNFPYSPSGALGSGFNSGPFSLSPMTPEYWLDSEDPLNSNSAMGFHFLLGDGIGISKDWVASSWAVRSGDVMVAAVPEPATYALMLACLATVMVVCRRRER